MLVCLKDILRSASHELQCCLEASLFFGLRQGLLICKNIYEPSIYEITKGEDIHRPSGVCVWPQTYTYRELDFQTVVVKGPGWRGRDESPCHFLHVFP